MNQTTKNFRYPKIHQVVAFYKKTGLT